NGLSAGRLPRCLGKADIGDSVQLIGREGEKGQAVSLGEGDQTLLAAFQIDCPDGAEGEKGQTVVIEDFSHCVIDFLNGRIAVAPYPCQQVSRTKDDGVRWQAGYAGLIRDRYVGRGR